LATTWIKPTYAHKRYNNKTTIKRKIDYITDREKTKNPNIDEQENDTEHSAEHGQTDTATIAPIISISDYIQNPEKTENNLLVTGYECFPEYAADQFATSMDLYERNTGRKHKDNSILLYHMRQSFAPGEVDPETANRIGYELALEFTKGEHAFVIATHTDKSHIHNHVIVNAFNLNCDGKFRDPWRSGKRHVARISDKLCKEYGLSVIEVKHGWSDPYNEWEQKQGITIADKEPTKREQLENIIAICLEKQPKDFTQLLKFLEDYACIAKKRGSNISITAPFSKNPIRLNSLSEQFTESGIKKQIEEMQNGIIESIVNETDVNIESENTKDKNTENSQDTFIITKEPTQPTKTMKTTKPTKPKLEALATKPKELQLLIDIQNSLKATENIGYKKWAEKFNLEQMSQTLLFIEKHQLSLSELENMATQKPKVLRGIKKEIEAVDEKLQQISLLQRHIGNYGKTKDIYRQYKQSKNPEQFKQENTKAITDHEAARAYFDECGYGFGSGNKLPTIKELREQYATHNADKKSLWAKYHEVRNSDKEIDNAWQNVRTLLNLKEDNTIQVSEEKAPKRNAPSL